MAEINPLRYRGYYYDTDSGFYYLQSRYYDPTICRFINADTYSSTGQGFVGYNMFAYCENDPLTSSDAGGHSRQDRLRMDIEADLSRGFWNIVIYNNSKWTTKFMRDWNALASNDDGFLENTDPQAVENASYFSAYKGSLVIKTPFKREAAFYGCIFYGGEFENPKQTLDHESGHAQQMKLLGISKFTVFYAIPSICGNLLNRNTPGKVFGISYYDLPWEYTADVLGGVEGREHANWADEAGLYYYVSSSLLPPY